MCLGSNLIRTLFILIIITVRTNFSIWYIINRIAFQVHDKLIFTVIIFPSSRHYLLILFRIWYFSRLDDTFLYQKRIIRGLFIWWIEKRLCLSLDFTVLFPYRTDLFLFSLRMLSSNIPLNLKGFIHSMSKVLYVLKIFI